MLNETGTTDGMKQEEVFESPFQDGNLWRRNVFQTDSKVACFLLDR